MLRQHAPQAVQRRDCIDRRVFTVDKTGFFDKKIPSRTFRTRSKCLALKLHRAAEPHGSVFRANAGGHFILNLVFICHLENSEPFRILLPLMGMSFCML